MLPNIETKMMKAKPVIEIINMVSFIDPEILKRSNYFLIVFNFFEIIFNFEFLAPFFLNVYEPVTQNILNDFNINVYQSSCL